MAIRVSCTFFFNLFKKNYVTAGVNIFVFFQEVFIKLHETVEKLKEEIRKLQKKEDMLRMRMEKVSELLEDKNLEIAK